MTYYLKSDALEELNEYGYTEILDKDGEKTGGLLVVHNGTCNCPSILNLFGCDEEIKLKNVTIDDEGDVTCTAEGYGGAEMFMLYQYKKDIPIGYSKSWTVDE